jgi:hypothetical protein
VKKIEPTGSRVRTIQVTGSTVTRVTPEEVAARLGAEPITPLLEHDDDLLSLAEVGSELVKRLRSSGGRPALVGATHRAKIPLSGADLEGLEKIAEAIASLRGFKPSVGQVASVILNRNIIALMQTTRELKDLDSPQMKELAASVAEQAVDTSEE